MPLEAGFILATLGIGAQVQQAQQQKKIAKEGLRQQANATRLATSRAAGEQRRQEREARRLNRRKPNIESILGSERQASLTGPGATALTGVAGIARERLTLGRSSALGVS